jgi:hypothetical protein
MNQKLSLLITATCVLACAAPIQAAQLNTDTVMTDTVPETTIPSSTTFAKVIDDLPLMPGLQLVEGEDVLFAEPVLGRIAETTAEGTVDVDDVYNYYRRSLPGLGWKVIDARDYIRENDHLRIDAHADGKTTSVRFSVRPLQGVRN